MKMDDIGSTNQHYKNISNISVTTLILILQAYLMLILSGIDLFNFSSVSNTFARYSIQVLVQLLLFTFIYSIVYFTVKKIYCVNWIKSHKNIWLKGIWLHIHVKNDIRVGTVDIEQNFYTIKATARNVYPGGLGKPQRETTWNYLLSKVFDDESVRDFVGYYKAEDITSQSSKDGVHVLHIENKSRDKKTGYANYMVGTFRDTVKISKNEIQDSDSHAGQLYFFRLSDKCREYLIGDNGFRYDLLPTLHEKAEFADEPYVIKLKECLGEKLKSEK